MAIVAHQVTYRGGSDGNVPAITDRRLYDFLLSNSTGVVEGLTPSLSSSGEYKFSAGWGFIQGCMFTVDNTLSVEMLATSSDTASRVIARLNVALSTIEFEEQLQPYPALVQEDILHNGSIYEVVLARFTLNSRNVSAATLEIPILVGMSQFNTDFETLRSQFDAAAAKLATIEQGAQVNTVTGVKGTKESSYRTGNVSLTAANVGAVPTTRTVNGKELSENITLNVNDIGVTPQNIGAMPAGPAGGDEMGVEQWLDMYWRSINTGFSSFLVNMSSLQNLRTMVICYKVSNNTGFALAINNYTDTVDSSQKNVIKVLRLSSNRWTVYEFYSDKTIGP